MLLTAPSARPHKSSNPTMTWPRTEAINRPTPPRIAAMMKTRRGVPTGTISGAVPFIRWASPRRVARVLLGVGEVPTDLHPTCGESRGDPQSQTDQRGGGERVKPTVEEPTDPQPDQQCHQVKGANSDQCVETELRPLGSGCHLTVCPVWERARVTPVRGAHVVRPATSACSPAPARWLPARRPTRRRAAAPWSPKAPPRRRRTVPTRST